MTEAIESSKDQKSSIIQYPPDSKLTHYSWIIIFSYEISFTFLELLNKIYVHKFYHKKHIYKWFNPQFKIINQHVIHFQIFGLRLFDVKIILPNKRTRRWSKDQREIQKKEKKKNKVDSLGKDFEFALWSPHVTMKIKGHGTNQAQNSTSAYWWKLTRRFELHILSISIHIEKLCSVLF